MAAQMNEKAVAETLQATVTKSWLETAEIIHSLDFLMAPESRTLGARLLQRLSA